MTYPVLILFSGAAVMNEGFIPSHSGYRDLLSYRKSLIVYDATVQFCSRFLIHQANYLLDRQIRQLEQAFLREGGIRERMTRARLEARRGKPKPP